MILLADFLSGLVLPCPLGLLAHLIYPNFLHTFIFTVCTYVHRPLSTAGPAYALPEVLSCLTRRGHG